MNDAISKTDPFENPQPMAVEAESPIKTARQKLALKDTPSLALAALLAVGVVSIYMLSPRAGPASALAAHKTIELEVDSALSRVVSNSLVAPEGHRAAAVVSSFYDRIKQRQVSLGEIRGNPFVFEIPGAKYMATHAQRKSASDAGSSTPEQVRAAEALGKLRLQAVLVSSHGPVAVISDQLFSEGAEVAGWTVSKIEPQRVTLKFGNLTHVLELMR